MSARATANEVLVPTRVSVIRPSERTRGTGQTPGMVREQAAAGSNFWAGLVKTDAGMTSGWHHHGDYDTTVFVVNGAVRLEFGAGGKEAVEGHAGDFVFIPKGTVHRESNPSADTSELVVFRAGTGAPAVNVEGPSPS